MSALVRFCLAWALYWIGDLIWRVFDHEVRLGRVLIWSGMHWLIYRTYSLLMTWSDAVQGAGHGPWHELEGGAA